MGVSQSEPVVFRINNENELSTNPFRSWPRPLRNTRRASGGAALGAYQKTSRIRTTSRFAWCVASPGRESRNEDRDDDYQASPSGRQRGRRTTVRGRRHERVLGGPPLGAKENPVVVGTIIVEVDRE